MNSCYHKLVQFDLIQDCLVRAVAIIPYLEYGYEYRTWKNSNCRDLEIGNIYIAYSDYPYCRVATVLWHSTGTSTVAACSLADRCTVRVPVLYS